MGAGLRCIFKRDGHYYRVNLAGASITHTAHLFTRGAKNRLENLVSEKETGQETGEQRKSDLECDAFGASVSICQTGLRASKPGLGSRCA